MNKICKICKFEKPLSDFPKAVTTADRRDIYCKPCKKQAQAAWYSKNRRKIKLQSMLHRAAKRAKRKRLQFELVLDDLNPIPLICPVLGITLNWDRGGKPAGDSPSLDRVDNSKGYVRGNIAIISNRANMIKCDACEEEIRKVADWLSIL